MPDKQLYASHGANRAEAPIEIWRRLPREVRMLVVARTVNRAGAFALPFMTLWLTQQIGTSIRTAGYAVAAFGLASMGSRLLGGWLADRWGRRLTIVTGLLGCAVALAAMAAAGTVTQGLGAVIVLGLSFEVYESPSQALIADSVDSSRRPAVFGLLGAALSVAAMVAGLVAAVLAPLSLRLLFVADAASCLAATLVVLRYVSSAPARTVRLPRHGAAAGPWHNPLFVWLFVANLAFAVCYLQVFVALPLTMRSRGVGAAGVGLLLTVSAVTVVIGQPLLRHPTGPSRSPRVAIATGFACLATGFAGYAFAGGLGGFLIATVVASIGDVLLMGHVVAIVSDLAPIDRRAGFLAAYGLSWGVAATIGPPAGACLLDHDGHDGLWLAAAGCCALLGGCQLAALRRYEFPTDLAKGDRGIKVDPV